MAGARVSRPHGKFTAGDALIGPRQGEQCDRLGTDTVEGAARFALALYHHCQLGVLLLSLFGEMGLFSSKTPQEVMRENKRMLDRSIRELDRERTMIEGQVKKTLGEMKKMAKAGQEVR